jgi:ABC-type Fe3+-hydroxamate transport system substrate-binding protein
MRRAALLVFLAGLVLAASACGERAEPTGMNVKLFPVTVSRPGESPITMDRAPARAAACAPVASSLVNGLTQGAGAPKILTATCTNGSAQALAGFRPDLVISTSPIQASAPVYVLPQGSIREAERGIVDVGALLGRPLQARGMVDRIETRRRTVQQKVATLPRTSVFLDTGFFITEPAHSLAGDILSVAGGRSIAGANPGQGPYDLGLLHAKNPDFYLATSDSGITLKDLRKNPRTRDLRAVKAGSFGIVPASYFQPGPDTGNGLLAVAKLLHPDAFR